MGEHLTLHKHWASDYQGGGAKEEEEHDTLRAELWPA